MQPLGCHDELGSLVQHYALLVPPSEDKIH